MRFAAWLFAVFLSLETAGVPRTTVWTVPDSVASGIHVMFMGRKQMEQRFNIPGGADISAYLLELCYRDNQSGFEEIGCEVQFTDHPFIPFDDYYTRDDMSFLRVRIPAGLESDALEHIARLLQKARTADKSKLKQAVRSCLMANRMRRSTRAAAEHKLKEHLFENCYVSMPTYRTEAVTDQASVQSFLKAYLSPENTVVAVVGSAQADQLDEKLEKLFGGDPLERPSLRCSPRERFSEKPIERTHPGGQGYVLMNAVIAEPPSEAGWAALHVWARRISQRISFQLREREGLAYSIGARITSIAGMPALQLYMGTSPGQVSRIPGRLKKMVADVLSEPIQQDELDRLCLSLLIDRRMKRLTNINKASFRSLDLLWGREPGFEQRVDEQLMKMTRTALKKASEELRVPFTTILVNSNQEAAKGKEGPPSMGRMPGGH